MTQILHPNEETLQRWRHAELAAPVDAEVAEHLRGCAACQQRQARLDEDEREVFGLLAALDRPVAMLSAHGVIARAKRERRMTVMRRAAAIVLVTGTAGVAVAMPGSPLRSWLAKVADQVGGRSEVPSVPQVAPAMSGVAVVPGERFVIRFTDAATTGEALVRLADDSSIVVRAALGSATFTSEAERLLIEPHVVALTVEIFIPRTAPLVEMQVGDERVFLKRGDVVTLREAAVAGDVYRIPLGAVRR